MNRYNQEDNNIKLMKGTSIGSGNMYRAKLIDSSGGKLVPNSSFNFSNLSERLVVPTTNQPYLISNLARLSPMPDDAPVIRQTFLFKDKPFSTDYMLLLAFLANTYFA